MIETRQENPGDKVAHLPKEQGPGNCPAQRMKKDENYKRVMLVAAGSAMAANCEPCLNMVVPNLLETGVPDSEIRRAVEIGQYVKDRKSDIMKEAADILTGTNFLDKEVPEGCTLAEMELVRVDKMSMLITVVPFTATAE